MVKLPKLLAWGPGSLLGLTLLLAACATQPGGNGIRPVIERFSANPESVTAGAASTLSWSVEGAASVTIEPQVGEVEATGEVLVTPTETTTYTLTARDARGRAVVTADTEVTVTTGPGTGGPVWTGADIGVAEGPQGRTEFNDGEVTVQGQGDIAFDSDAFHFTYTRLEGDGAIVARVAEHAARAEGADLWPKVGLMVRANLEPDAANATLYLVENGSFRGAVLQSRASAGAGTAVEGTDRSAVAPYWLKLERAGATVEAAVSPDGRKWTTVGSVAPALGEVVYVGLAVASGNRTGVIEGVFTDVTIDGPAATIPPTGPTEPPAEDPDEPPAGDPDEPPAEDPQRPGAPPAPNPGEMVSAAYEEDRGIFPNPERGWHSEVNLIAGTGFSGVRANGYTLARSYVRLDDYRNRPLPDSLLGNLRSGLQQARDHGIKIILRFSYNFGKEPDAPLDIVLRHIEQLAPVLNEYQDVIAVLHAGFIGAWGEWHQSTNGLATVQNKRIITNALLEALPETRMIQVRTPWHLRDVLGSPDPDLVPFSGAPQARVGFKNDCFLTTEDDAGTYGGQAERDRAEARIFTQYTVMGGETCTIAWPSDRSRCPTALKELAEYHWDYLNAGFYSGVLNRWRDEGCYDQISRDLGYRLTLREAAATAWVTPGGVLSARLRMANTGFGKVYNPRPIDLVLRDTATGRSWTVRATADARQLLPLAGQTRDIALDAALPADLPAGRYELLLALPDPAATLADDPRYNIRLANRGVWEERTGLNALGLTISVE